MSSSVPLRGNRFPWRQAELLAQQVEQIGSIRSVKNAELRRQPEGSRVDADQLVGDRVERATNNTSADPARAARAFAPASPAPPAA